MIPFDNAFAVDILQSIDGNYLTIMHVLLFKGITAVNRVASQHNVMSIEN